jgi:threonine/homoserine/homoserine lactone efflux protein
MWLDILIAVCAVMLWVFTYFFIKGVDWIMISGVSTLPKEEKERYRKKHDVTAMNRYTGKMMLLPMAIIFTVGMVFRYVPLEAGWMDSWWFSTIIIVALLGFLGWCFYVISQVLGNRFVIKN